MRHLTNEETPKPIVLVRQRELDDCAVACIAMVAGVSYDEVIKETGKPEFIKCLREKRLPARQREMNEKFNQFMFNRGFAILPIANPTQTIRGRRYVANIIIRHPETNEPSALEHNVVIDESGVIFNPTLEPVDPSLKLRVSVLREIVYLGDEYIIPKR
ncbi:MAG: hypothetical protein ACJ71W_21720 [Terriglobales bacterium]